MSTNTTDHGRNAPNSKSLRDLIIVALIWLAVSLLTLFGAFSRFDLWIDDLFARAATDVSDKAPVAIVAIDQQSLMEAGERWPWPRSRHAELLEAAKTAGASAVVFDIVFDQPSEDDEVFAQAISDFKNVVLAAEQVTTRTPQGLIESTAMPARILGEAGAVGLASIPLDADGRVRRMPLTSEGLVFKAYSLIKPNTTTRAGPGDLIRFRQNAASPDIFSYVQVLNASKQLPAGALKDQILLVGLALPANPAIQSTTGDEVLLPHYASPVTAGQVPGVLAHANALATLLQDDALKRAPRTVELLMAVLFAAASVGAAFMTRIHFRSSMILWLGVFLALAFVLAAGRMAGLAVFAGATLTGLFATSAYSAISAGLHGQRERARLVRGFGRYVAPAVLKDVVQNPSLPALGGETRTISAVVTDLEGYTAFMNSVSADEGADILSRYLDRLGDVVIAHGGLIDQFIGDSIIAIFNAPVEHADHALRALNCVRALEQEGLRFQADLKAEGVTFGATRIGAHIGPAVVGNFGTRERFHYTAIGEVMNIASRLEAANKKSCTRVLVSRSLYEAADAPNGFHYQGEFDLKGIDSPLPTFSTEVREN